jgi:hypothetical protein
MHRGPQARVHWWYLPDSYEEFISCDAAPTELETDVVDRLEGAPPWKVYCRWVSDSEKYNEWMNPLDYETKEAQAEQEQQAAGATATMPAATAVSAGAPLFWGQQVNN